MNHQIQALADYMFTSKYAKYISEQKRRETWEECIQRSYEMHRQKFKTVWEQLLPHVDEAFHCYRSKKCLGSQRNLQFAGDAVFKHEARGYNCSGSYCDRMRFFQEAMYLLLCGTGVGFSVQKHHIEKLPKLHTDIKTEVKTYVIEDSIEGWANSIGVLISSYFDQNEIFSEYSNKIVQFDYSLIRPKGSPFSHGIGKAPGYEPLKHTHDKIVELLNKRLSEGYTKIRPIDAYDLVMHSSDAVLSGGIRRSATICIFSYDDKEMRLAKTGNWYITNPQRGRSNNSALLLKNKECRDEFHDLVVAAKEFGDPGFFWADSTELLCNPCFTEDTWIMTKIGAKKIKELIGNKFEAYVDGKLYSSTDKGFFYTGFRDVYEIETLEGFKVKSTDNHKFLMNDDSWKELKDIKIGDEIKVHNHSSVEWKGDGTFEEGWLIGNMIGDGFITEKYAALDYWGENREEMLSYAINCLNESNLKTYHNFKGGNQIANVGKKRVHSKKLMDLAHSYDIRKDNKVITDKIEAGSSDFYKGIISGYFDADGSVQGLQKESRNIRLASINLENLEAVQRMLLRLGIYSKIYKNRAKLRTTIIGGKPYTCQPSHELMISKGNIIKFYKEIGFKDSNKQNKLKSYIESYKTEPYSTKYIGTVSKISLVGKEKVYDCTIPEIHAFDANGFYAHNCCEIGFYCYDEFGNSGWQFCNLSTINGSKIKTKADFFEAAKAATIIGTLQAGYTNFPYLGEVSERIAKREALLGVSITGMYENPDVLLNEATQKAVAKSLIEINEKIAGILRINPAARITCVKPEGSTSCMLGTASGIHPHHSRKFIRRVQANKMESPARFYADLNPRSIEESTWSANKTDYCISFACEITNNKSIFKKDISALQHLEDVKKTKQNWITGGTIKSRCSQPWLEHNVSNTIVVRTHEWELVENYIYENRQHFSGVTLISDTGDKDFSQAPFTEVFTPDEIVAIHGEGSLFASGIIEDALKIYGDLWVACNQVLGIGENLSVKKVLEHEEYYRIQKLSFVDRINRFAKKYTDGDIRKLTYLLKDVYNWKLWLDIQKEYKKVNYTNMIEEENTTKGTGEIACAGGMCAI